MGEEDVALRMPRGELAYRRGRLRIVDHGKRRFTIEGFGDPFLVAHILEQAGIDVISLVHSHPEETP